MRKHLVKYNKTRTISGSKSYETYVENSKGGKEWPEANPDMLLESDGMYYADDDNYLSEQVSQLIKQAKKILTAREWETFDLLAGLGGKDVLTMREAAIKMGVHTSRVGQLWDAARLKLDEIWKEQNRG